MTIAFVLLTQIRIIISIIIIRRLDKAIMIIRFRWCTIIKRSLVKRNISFFINFKIKLIFHVNNKFSKHSCSNATTIKVKNFFFNFAISYSKTVFNSNSSSSLNSEARSIFNNLHVFYSLITIFSIIILSTTIDNHISKNINRVTNKNINKNFSSIEVFNYSSGRIMTRKNRKIKKQRKKHIKKITTLKNTTMSIMNPSVSSLVYSTITISFMTKHITFSLLNRMFITAVDVKRNFISTTSFINICVTVQFNRCHRRNQSLQQSTISMLSLFNLMLTRIVILI